VLLTLWGMELFSRRGGFYEKGTVIVPDLGVEIVRLTSSVPRPVRFGPFRQRYNNCFVLTFIVHFRIAWCRLETDESQKTKL
jgi:hypothetical protein